MKEPSRHPIDAAFRASRTFLSVAESVVADGMEAANYHEEFAAALFTATLYADDEYPVFCRVLQTFLVCSWAAGKSLRAPRVTSTDD